VIRRAFLFVALSTLSACMASNVVAVEDRTVVTAVDQVIWQPATAEDVPGLFASESIEGPAAAALLKIYYLFQPDGTFTAAALVQSGAQSEFQVLSGTWTFADGELLLGEDAAPAALEAADGELLRMSGEEGAVVLRKDVLR
jgi:hypothetical protein